MRQPFLIRIVPIALLIVPVALLGAACSSLLGIEEIHENPQATTASGSGGAGASGGSASLGGANGTSNSGATDTSGGGTDDSGGAGGSSAGGDAGSGGMGEGGEGTTEGTGGATGTGGTGTSTGGTGGAGTSTGGTGTGGAGGTGGMTGDTTVRGRLVNHWLQPISGVTVMIGSQEAVTNSEGRFEVADVADVYDAMMVIRYRRYGNDGPEYGWVFEGLTRRDPTLQVYGGLSLRSANIMFTPNNLTTGGTRVLGTALGGDYGAWYREGSTAVSTSTSWYGPETVTASAHGLLWEETSGLPTAYLSYDTSSAPIALTDSTATTSFSLDLADDPVTSGSISGSVTSPTSDDRENRVFVRFTSNAVIPVVEHYGATLSADFTYTVPNLPNASITVAASEGTSSFGSAAVAHRDGLSSGQNSIDLTIPSPAVLNAPASDTTLADDTVFSWSGDAQTFVWHAESENYYEGIYVVTARKQITMPSFPNGWELRGNVPYLWRVETHGENASVDAMTGDEGFIDEFGPSLGDEPSGPQRTSGSYSISVSRRVTTPP